MPLFYGESAGPRIVQYGVGLSSIDTNHQGDLTTWELTPSGEMGDNVFRSVGVSFTATNGWSIGVTVVIDGQSLGEKVYGGIGQTETGQAQYYCKRRGNSIAVRVRTLSRSGSFSISNIQVSFKALRQWP